MTDAEEDIHIHTELLAIYRRKLKHDLRQRAALGVLAPFALEEAIQEAYSQISRSKELLRSWDVEVNDKPDDAPAEHAQLIAWPPYRLPQFETRGCIVNYSFWDNQQPEKYLRLDLRSALFMTQPSDQTTFIPSHRFTIKFQLMNQELGPWLGGVKFHASDQKNTSVSDGGIEIKGPTLFECRYYANTKMTPTIESSLRRPIVVTLMFALTNSESAIPVDVEVKYVRTVGGGSRWQYGNYTFIGS